MTALSGRRAITAGASSHPGPNVGFGPQHRGATNVTARFFRDKTRLWGERAADHTPWSIADATASAGVERSRALPVRPNHFPHATVLGKTLGGDGEHGTAERDPRRAR